MTISKIAVYITLFLCFACESGKEVTPEIILPEPSSLEKILTRGSLEISTFYNTTDYYTVVLRGDFITIWPGILPVTWESISELSKLTTI